LSNASRFASANVCTVRTQEHGDITVSRAGEADWSGVAQFEGGHESKIGIMGDFIAPNGQHLEVTWPPKHGMVFVVEVQRRMLGHFTTKRAIQPPGKTG
jgi:hypothetical protein